MESSTAKYYSRLDHLRFIAALLVLVWHSIHFQNVAPTSYVPTFWPLSILEEGHTGVALFMTLSGFIFHALCRNRKIIYLEFIRNRILRIAPLFLVWTLYLFYTENIDPTKLAVAMLALLNRDVVPGVGWTIIVEFQFYLIFPFLLSFSLRYGIRYLIALVVLAMLFRLGTWYTQGSVQVLAYWTIFGRIDQFLMGMIGSELFFRYPRQIGRLRVLISLLVAWIVLYQRFNSLGGFYNHSGYPSPSSIWVYFPTLEGIFYSLIAASYMALDRKIPRLVDKCLSWLGTLSFSFYLNHLLVIAVCLKLCADVGWSVKGFEQGLLFCFLVVLPCLTVLSAFTYRLIELPFLAMRRNYLGVDQRSLVTAIR
ncbi:MAG: acyltransferase [Burkholderiales bacterium]|nr:acyltransferase [Burkholderiales bacterium]OJX06179.1 MAG: hypothetical protein BGO72_04035 [Burkholderiales bacterium 70-64]